MMNNLFNAIVIAALVGTFVMTQAPKSVPTSPRPTVLEPPVVSRTMAVAADVPANQPPIPFVRGARPLPTASAAEAPLNEAVLPRPGLDRSAAKAAIEADGYKDVNALARESDGTWRGKAYRGATEVQVAVDGAGRVSVQ